MWPPVTESSLTLRSGCPRRGKGPQVGHTGHCAEAVARVGQVGLAITKDDHRPRKEKWSAVLDYLAEISEDYSDMARFAKTEVDKLLEMARGPWTALSEAARCRGRQRRSTAGSRHLRNAWTSCAPLC